MSVTTQRLEQQLEWLRLLSVKNNYAEIAAQAARQQTSHIDYLARLIDSESAARDQRALERRLASARFPYLKALDGFQWNWPKKINRAQIQNLFQLGFVKAKSNVVFMGGVGVGKTHIATALTHAAVTGGYTARYAPASGLTPRSVLEQMATVQMVDVHLPTTESGKEIVLRRRTVPEKAVELILNQMKLALPAQPPPEIRISGKDLKQ